MRVLDILRQRNNDLLLLLICEHCDHEIEISGYDDENFHSRVVPNLVCENCAKIAPDDFRPCIPRARRIP